MNIDWNWFFSSFCQSAAALIGIIAAFIISRLLGLSEKISSTISQFDNLMIEYNKIVASIQKRDFKWYTETNVRYDYKLREAVKNGEYNGLSDGEILTKIYESDSNIFKIDEAVMSAFKNINEVNIRAKKSLINLPNLDFLSQHLSNELNKEKEAIDLLEIESKTLIQHFQQNLQDLNSFKETISPLKIIIIVLMISFPLTVIYPLNFMPVILNQTPILTYNPTLIIKSIFTLKFILLFVFFLTIEGLFFYFLTLTNDIGKKLNNAIQNNNEDVKKLNTYSEYFVE